MGLDPTEALLALERAAPASVESALAWEDLTGARPSRGIADAAPESTEPQTKSGDTPTADVLSAVRPNPTTGASHAPLALGAPARVRAAVYDALGREVAVIHEGEMEAGAHALRVESAGWAPGLYLLRVDVTGEDGATERHLRRFTVVR